jgi:hypothetical protein
MMEITKTTLGDRMAAAIDRRITGEGWDEEWGNDLSDSAFRQAYEELGQLGVSARDVARVLEGVRQVRNDCTDIHGPPRDPAYERTWKEKWRGLLVGYFAMPPMVRVSPASGERKPAERVQFEDDTRTVVMDGDRHAFEDTDAYKAWKFVFKSKGWVTNRQIAEALGRGNEGARMDRLKKRMPKKLARMVGPGKKGRGHQIVLTEP